MNKQRINSEPWSEVPELLASLYGVTARLEILFPGRKFTPDGHLVGSLGEVIAAHTFNLRLLEASTPEHDAKTADGHVSVQIKLTQGRRGVGLRAEPEHLLVLRLVRTPALSVEVVYNGPGAAPWLTAGPQQRNGQRTIALSRLRSLNDHVAHIDRLVQHHEVDLRA